MDQPALHNRSTPGQNIGGPITLRIPHSFASRKSAISWPEAGMSPDRHQEWLAALRTVVLPHRAQLEAWVAAGIPLTAHAVISGPKSRVGPLDVHDALSQLIDEITNVAFPRERGSRSPQWQDCRYWEVRAEKQITEEGYVEVEIAPLQAGSEVDSGTNSDASQRDRLDAFHRDLAAAGLLRAVRTPDREGARERPLVRIQGKPLSETIVEERR